MEAQLGNNKLTLRDRTFNLLTQATTWAAFSNDGFQGNRSNPIFYDSLESIHGQIHGLTGMNGHMSVVDFAAFDPVFVRYQCSSGALVDLWKQFSGCTIQMSIVFLQFGKPLTRQRGSNPGPTTLEPSPPVQGLLRTKTLLSLLSAGQTVNFGPPRKPYVDI